MAKKKVKTTSTNSRRCNGEKQLIQRNKKKGFRTVKA